MQLSYLFCCGIWDVCVNDFFFWLLLLATDSGLDSFYIRVGSTQQD